MQITPETLNILKSFTTINASIYVKEGNLVKTISPQKTILAIAEVEDEFKTPFGIYDLPQFLSTISLFDDAEFDFGEKEVQIKNGVSSVRYTFADENMISQVPEQKLALPDEVVVFDLEESVLAKTTSAASVLQLPNWSVVGDGKTITIVVGDVKNESGNTFRYEVGETDSEFDLTFKIDNLKFMPGNYKVRISSKGISHWATNEGKLQYYIATESR